MDNNNRQPVYDVASYDIVTNALVDLLNQYPMLDNETITFGDVSADYGKAMFPSSGAIVVSEIRDILGNREQTCNYPFVVLYRAGAMTATNKISAKEWLDQLGRWLEKQPITVDGETYQIAEYPTLSENRKFTQISRTTPATLNDILTNNVEEWAISITAQYRNKIYRF